MLLICNGQRVRVFVCCQVDCILDTRVVSETTRIVSCLYLCLTQSSIDVAKWCPNVRPRFTCTMTIPSLLVNCAVLKYNENDPNADSERLQEHAVVLDVDSIRYQYHMCQNSVVLRVRCNLGNEGSLCTNTALSTHLHSSFYSSRVSFDHTFSRISIFFLLQIDTRVAGRIGRMPRHVHTLA